MQTKVNVDDLETREVFYTRAQDGFSLKSKSKLKEQRLEVGQNATPVKKSRPAKHKSGFIQGRRLFSDEDDNTVSLRLTNAGANIIGIGDGVAASPLKQRKSDEMIE